MKQLLIIFFLANTSIAAFAQRTDFSGMWILDKSRTQFGDAPEYVLPRYYKVDQQSSKIILSITTVDQQSKDEPTVVDSLGFDGVPFERKSTSGLIASSLKWNNDRSFTLTKKSQKVNITETWTEEDNGKTLVCDRSVEQTGNGFKYNIKGYYTKQ